jgi:hypothetical protein
MLNRIVLTLVFTLSFLEFMAHDLTLTLQLVPLILFAVLVFFKVLWSESVLKAVGSLFDLDGLLFVFFLSAFIVAPSLASDYEKSPTFSLFLCLCLVLARLYMAVVPIPEVLEAFFWSGLLSIGIFVPLSFAGFMQSMATFERFSPFSFHPNLLGFLLVGYLCAMVWKFMTGVWRLKILTGLVGSVYLIVIFFASSRSAIVAIAAGCVFIVVMEFLRATIQQRKRFMQMSLLVTSALLLVIVVFVQNSERAANAFNFFDQVLQLTNDYRGVGTGFSGRLDRWQQVMHRFSDGTFLVGKGIRYTDLSESQAIDNSYLVILYEVGVVPLILIMWRYLSILRRFLRAYLRTDDQVERRFYLAGGLLLVVLLVSNFAERYLFGVGNPYSLIAFLLFASPTNQVDRCFNASMSDLTLQRPRANCPAASSHLSS